MTSALWRPVRQFWCFFLPNLIFCEKFPSSRHKVLVIAFFGALESQLRLDIATANQIQNRLADSKVILVVPRAILTLFRPKSPVASTFF
jgi:hypothetical protein